MHLNIKNDEAHRLASELARLTGESLTQAVTAALRERLERERRKREVAATVERVREIVRASGEAGPLRSTDHGDLLYDERGLPK